MAGDGKWHYLTLEWRQYNSTFSNTGGYSLLSIDGVTLSSANWLQTENQSINSLGTTTTPLVMGAATAYPWPALKGLSVSDIGFWVNNAWVSAQHTFFTYTGTYNDIVNFGPVGMTDDGYPAEVIEPATQVDVLPITGASPELGYLSVLTGTITGTSVVSGPSLYPAFATTATLNNASTAHTPGAIRLTLAWQGGNAPGSPVTFTPSAPAGYSWSPSTITLTGSPTTGDTETGSAVLTVPSGQTLNSFVNIDVTNNGGIVPVSVTFEVILATAQVTSAWMTPNGNILWLRATDLSGNPSAVTAADLSLTTIAKNGGVADLAGKLSPSL